MTEGYGGSPEALDARIRRLEGLVTEARYAADEASRQEREWRQQTRLGMPCPHCGQPPGEWCTIAYGRTAGRRSPYLHESRGRILRTAATYARTTGRLWEALTQHQHALNDARRKR